MPNDPTGKRHTPSIPKGKGNNWDSDPHGGTDAGGSSNTKSPTGSRPMPTVPAHTPPHVTVPGAMKAPMKHTPMPRPSAARGTGAPKSEGGGGY